MKVHLHRPIIDRLIHHVSILVDSNTIGQAVWYNNQCRPSSCFLNS